MKAVSTLLSATVHTVDSSNPQQVGVPCVTNNANVIARVITIVITIFNVFNYDYDKMRG